MTSNTRKIITSRAANIRWARTTDRAGGTAAARTAARSTLNDRLMAEFNLEPNSPQFEERLKAARRAHFQGLALKSARSRQRKAVRS